MPATITASGTWSALQNTGPLSQAPGPSGRETISQMEQTVEQRAVSTPYRDGFTRDIDGMQEVAQFAGLMADGYDIGSRAALVRIRAIVTAMLGQEDVENRRVLQN